MKSLSTPHKLVNQTSIVVSNIYIQFSPLCNLCHPCNLSHIKMPFYLRYCNIIRRYSDINSITIVFVIIIKFFIEEYIDTFNFIICYTTTIIYYYSAINRRCKGTFILIHKARLMVTAILSQSGSRCVCSSVSAITVVASSLMRLVVWLPPRLEMLILNIDTYSRVVCYSTRINE